MSVWNGLRTSEYMKHLGWSNDHITSVASIFESSRQQLRDALGESCSLFSLVITLGSSLPRLVKVECSLLELKNEEDDHPPFVDFSHRLAYYNVTFHVLSCPSFS